MADRPPESHRRGPFAAIGATVSSLAVCVLAVSAAIPAKAGMVQVSVTGVAEARGHVRVELCTQDTFLTDACPYQGAAPAIVGATIVSIEAPPGRYAVQAFQDDTDQGVVHQNLLGIPRERIGFSNDAPVRLTGPRFRDAAFSVGSAVERITIRLRAIFHRGD